MKSYDGSFYPGSYFLRQICGFIFHTVAGVALLSIPLQATTYTLGTTILLLGPALETNGVLLTVTPATDPWNAAAQVPWLHLAAASHSGEGGTNIVFSCDANSGATRTGVLTIGDQTLTITQAGSSYVAAGLVPLVSSGLNTPFGTAVDNSGNVYIADTGNNAIKVWSAASNTVTAVVSSGLSTPYGVAVDTAGNLYVADSGNNAIKMWSKATQTMTTLVSSGLNRPLGLAVDDSGDVNIADTSDNAIKMWSLASNTLSTLVSSGLSQPMSVAPDGSGNVYIGDTLHSAIKEWFVTGSNVITLATSGLSKPHVASCKATGNVYVADTGNNAIKKWSLADGAVTTLATNSAVGYFLFGLAVDYAENVFLSDYGDGVLFELPKAFVDPSAKMENNAAGNDSLPAVVPATENLRAPLNPTSDQPWLAITGVTNGVVSFSFTSNSGPARLAHINLLGQAIPIFQGTNYTFALGTTSLVVSAATGTHTVILATTPFNGTWQATANAAWLHLSAASQSGAGGTNMVFTCDTNPGEIRTGALSIADQTLTVTQVSSNYVPAGLIQLVSSGLNQPNAVAVDTAGNVYIADSGNNAIKEWVASNSATITLVSSGLDYPLGVAVDREGNVYIADTYNNAAKKWTASNNSLATLVAAGLNNPSRIAVDDAGHVYIADTGNNQVKIWSPASKAVSPLVSVGLSYPYGLALDVQGNVYIANHYSQTITEWNAQNQTASGLASGFDLYDLAVDGSGTIYEDAGLNSLLIKRTPLAGDVSAVLNLGISGVQGMVADGPGNVYIADYGNGILDELPSAFVIATAQEGYAAGNDSLIAVVPATANLGANPVTSDQPWLTITGASNGMVSFSFLASLSIYSRTAHISVLGQSISVTQAGLPFSLGVNSVVEGPTAGSDSVVLAAGLQSGPWAAAANAAWLHLSPANQGGAGGTNVVFSYDANAGATRTGTLTIAGQTLAIIQAGVNYVPAGPLAISPAGLFFSINVAVDAAGNLYLTDPYNNLVSEWVAANNSLITLISSGLYSPRGIAVDSAGNLYIGDTFHNALKKWTSVDSSLTALITSGLLSPVGVALDGGGNIYIADAGNNAIKVEAADGSYTNDLVSAGLNDPSGVALDAAGNVYIADSANSAIKMWTAANSNVTTLVGSGLSAPNGLAVDGAGNVYIADTYDGAIKKWSAVDGSVSTFFEKDVLPTGIGTDRPTGVAVDTLGNVYVADTSSYSINEVPRAFVDPTARIEYDAAGSDSLPMVLPAAENLLSPFAPTSDRSWLSVTGVTNGVVSFSFTANQGPPRTAHINLLGQSIPIKQVAIGTPTTLAAVQSLADGVFRFSFTNDPNASFSVLSTTDLSLPLSLWTFVGSPTNIGSGLFQFATRPVTNDSRRYYTVRSP